MGGKYSSKKKKKKKESPTKGLGAYLIIVMPIMLLCILFSYFVLQGIAERLGLSPVIFLGITANSWMTSGEAILMFVVWLSLGIITGLILSYILIKIATR